MSWKALTNCQIVNSLSYDMLFDSPKMIFFIFQNYLIFLEKYNLMIYELRCVDNDKKMLKNNVLENHKLNCLIDSRNLSNCL